MMKWILGTLCALLLIGSSGADAQNVVNRNPTSVFVLDQRTNPNVICIPRDNSSGLCNGSAAPNVFATWDGTNLNFGLAPVQNALIQAEQNRAMAAESAISAVANAACPQAGCTMTGPSGVVLNQTTPPPAYFAVHTVQNTSRTAQSIYAPQVPPTWFTVDGYRSVMVALPGSTATNTNGFAYYVSNQTPSGGLGQNAVGVYGTTTCEVDGCSSWGINPTVIDGTTGGVTGAGQGRRLIGGEFDISATQSGTTVQGISLLGSSTVQPGGGANGFSCGSLGGPAKWTQCFVVPDGVATGGMFLGSTGAPGAANTPSLPIMLSYHDGSGVGASIKLQSILGVLNVSNPQLGNYMSFKPAADGSAPTIAAQGTNDANVALNFSGKGTAGVNVLSPLIAQSYAAVTGFLNVGGQLTLTDNTTVVPAAGALATAFTVNQSGGGGETDLWNTFSTANTSFAFNQITGTGTFTTPFKIVPGGANVNGILGVTGATTVGGTLGVTGTTNLGVLNTSGVATLASTSVTGNETVGGTLGVTGNSSFSTLSSSGLATLNSAGVTGALTAGNLTVSGSTTLGFTTANSGFKLTNNTTAVPSAQLGTAFSANQGGGTAETDIWNTFTGASSSFAFNQVTGTGTFQNLMSLSSTVNSTARPMKLPSFTVATLPTCNATYQDSMAVVSDATAPTYRGALTGGGTVRTPVYCDGTSWTSH